jgi:hypothetical protein
MWRSPTEPNERNWLKRYSVEPNGSTGSVTDIYTLSLQAAPDK